MSELNYNQITDNKQFITNNKCKQYTNVFFSIHSETFNIWSHFLPFIASFIILVYDYNHTHYVLSDLSLFTTMITFLCSTIAHSLYKYNESYEYIIFFIDRTSILITINCIELSVFNFCFYDHYIFFVSFSAIASISNSVICAYLFFKTFIKKITLIHFQYIIIAVPNIIIVLFFSITVAALKMNTIFDHPDVINPFIINSCIILFSVIFNLILGFPENYAHWFKLKPENFNIIGHSHHWWHIFSTIYLFWFYYQIKYWYHYFTNNFS